jgi:hypothetical protein
MTTDESRCVVCGGKVEEYRIPWGDPNWHMTEQRGYHCSRCKLRYSDLPPKSYGLTDKIRILEGA